MGPQNAHPLFLILLLSTGLAFAIDEVDYDYDYGDPNVDINAVTFSLDTVGPRAEPVKPNGLEKVINLCCEEGKMLRSQVLNSDNCDFPSPGFLWSPKLSGASGVKFKYKGLPVCEHGNEHIDMYQKDVVFTERAELLLPHYVRLDPIPSDRFCVSKVYDPDSQAAEAFHTKVFVCLDRHERSALIWTCVGIAHFLLLVTLITYFVMSELRCLQGQYMICLLISLLIYNICLYPLSEIPLDISDISCIALGAVKYFFFCGVFLWFNVMCFDVWRTLSNRQDVSGRRRFLFYSAYSWLIAAVLTTVVLVLPYTSGGNQGATNDPVKEAGYLDTCKLKMEVHMILQLAQLISILIDLICLLLATCNICGYDQLGNGLLRSDASLCLKQSWKMFIIMIAHVFSTIDSDMIKFPIPQWQYILLESIAIFGVFAYRKTIVRWCIFSVCGSKCHSRRETGTQQEKNQLTLA